MSLIFGYDVANGEEKAKGVVDRSSTVIAKEPEGSRLFQERLHLLVLSHQTTISSAHTHTDRHTQRVRRTRSNRLHSVRYTVLGIPSPHTDTKLFGVHTAMRKTEHCLVLCHETCRDERRKRIGFSCCIIFSKGCIDCALVEPLAG